MLHKTRNKEECLFAHKFEITLVSKTNDFPFHQHVFQPFSTLKWLLNIWLYFKNYSACVIYFSHSKYAECVYSYCQNRRDRKILLLCSVNSQTLRAEWMQEETHQDVSGNFSLVSMTSCFTTGYCFHGKFKYSKMEYGVLLAHNGMIITYHIYRWPLSPRTLILFIMMYHCRIRGIVGQL